MWFEVEKKVPVFFSLECEILVQNHAPFSLRNFPITSLTLHMHILASFKQLCFQSAFPVTSHLSPQPLTLTNFFFFPRRSLRRNVIQHIQTRAPANLCCKHVPTDSLKELIAPNNLTIWLWRSILVKLLAQWCLGPIQMPAMLLWCRKREREKEGKVVRLARRLKRGRNDKEHHLLHVFLVSDPGRQQRPCIAMIQLQPSIWNVIHREDGELQGKSKKGKKRKRRDKGIHPFFFSLSQLMCLPSSFTCC